MKDEYTGPTCMEYVTAGLAYSLVLHIDIGGDETLMAQEIIMFGASDEVIDKGFEQLKQAFKNSIDDGEFIGPFNKGERL